MRQLTKPVWAEGMYLGPHHFQAQARYFEDSLHFAAQSLWADGYGFATLQVDPDQLRNGSVFLSQAKGLFEDGLAFDIPGCDGELPARSFADLFPAAAEHLTLYLAIPADVPEGRNTSLGGDGSVPRYQAVDRQLADAITGRDERKVKLGKKNFSLLTEAELTESFASLPVVRVVRDGAGRFAADPSFVPPCLQIAASPALTAMLGRLTEILEQKSLALSLGGDQGGRGFQAGLSSGQVSEFWFLHALNSSISGLTHYLRSGNAHPRDLFREMLRLGGALCTFGTKVQPTSLPLYDHKAMGACFGALDAHIRQHLELPWPSRAIVIPLDRAGESTFHGEIKDERCVGPSRWILEVNARLGEADLIDRVPRLMKFCSAKFVSELVKRLLPGMTLSHLTVPPAEIDSRVDCQYFAVSRSGPCWEHILQSRQAGIYVPAEIPLVAMRLMVLLNR